MAVWVPKRLVFSGDRIQVLDLPQVRRWNWNDCPPGILPALWVMGEFLPVVKMRWEVHGVFCSRRKPNQTTKTNKKQLPRELLTTVCLLISSGFKFILAMWSRKPHNERGMQSSLWLVLPCLYHSEWGSPRSLFLLTLSLLFEKILHLQGFKCMFHWPEWFVRHLSSPSCKSHGRVFLAGHSAEGIILDSANKKEGGMDLDRRPALSATRCKG